MKLTDLMESQELLELGILDRFTKAGKARLAGADKAAKIFTNLKAQYFNLVGGSRSNVSTLTDLQNFMTGHGLDVSKLPPVSDPARLTSADINNSLKAVVAQNYSRIIAAQRGDDVTPAQTQTVAQVTVPSTPAAPVGPTPEQVRKQKQAAAAKAAQAQMTPAAPVSTPVTALSPEEIRKQKQAAAAKAAQAQMTAPAIAPVPAPATPAAPVRPPRKPRAPRKPAAPKSTAPESKQQDKPVVAEYYSKFLGINL